MKNKLYILTDKSLEPIYAAVQGGHAAAQWLIEFGQDSWNNDYLIYLSVDIKEWYDKLHDKQDFISFLKTEELYNLVYRLASQDPTIEITNEEYLAKVKDIISRICKVILKENYNKFSKKKIVLKTNFQNHIFY